ncbi:MAG: ATP-grasp domain-containing protein [Gammaproteobacteria bacterium]
MRLSASSERAPARPAVLLIAPASSYRLAPYLQAANGLGLEPIVVSEGEHSLVGAVSSGIHVRMEDARSGAERIVQALGGRPIAGVVGTDDATVPVAAQVAGQLGLVHNPPGAALLSRRKDLARARLQAAGIPVPRHRRLDLHAPLNVQVRDLPYPSVVKPLSLSGSRGVIRADDPTQMQAACARVGTMLRGDDALGAEERRYLLAEAFVPGPEVALEGMLRGGRLQVLALFDKPDPLDGPYFEETYYVTPSRHPAADQERVAQRVQQACAAYGLREGPVHAELRLHAGDAWIMEVAARTIGGQCARLLGFGTGRTLEDLVVSRAVGRDLPLPDGDGAAGVLMIPIARAGSLRRVEGVLAARGVRYIEDLEISVREGYELVPLPEGSSYLGFIFARARAPEQVEAALRQAHSHLNIVTAPVFRLEKRGESVKRKE